MLPGRFRFAPLWSIVAAWSAGCGGDASSAATPPPVEQPESNEPRGEDEGEVAWRYGPTLHEAIPSGVTVAPIAELASPDRARLHIVAAVHRPGAEPELRVEQWSFTQFNEKGTLASEGEPEVVVRTVSGQAEPPAFEAVRLELASPRVQVLRPVGLPVDDAAALLKRLATQAKLVRDTTAAPRARVDALAEVVRGLDDHVVFTSRRLIPVLDGLASGAYAIGTQRAVSERRVAIRTSGDPPHELEVVRKSDGWAIVDDRPAPVSR